MFPRIFLKYWRRISLSPLYLFNRISVVDRIFLFDIRWFLFD